jgi:desulfoferrodoxin (superoxide reductase-like protein)
MFRLLQILSLPLLAQAFQGQPIVSSPDNCIARLSKSPSLSMTLSNDGPSIQAFLSSAVSRRDVVKAAAAGPFVATALASGASPALAADVAMQMKALEKEFKDSVNSNGAPEKHIPKVSIGPVPGKPELRTVEVVVPHVMDADKPHFIQAIWLKEEKTGDVAVAKVTDKRCDALVVEGDTLQRREPHINCSPRRHSTPRNLLHSFSASGFPGNRALPSKPEVRSPNRRQADSLSLLQPSRIVEGRNVYCLALSESRWRLIKNLAAVEA